MITSGPTRGRFLTLEGIEGSGKSTQFRRLAHRLEELGHPLVATREPGGTPLGTEIRRLLLDPASRGMDPRAELLLYCADRAEHVAQVVAPALARGAHVICDRSSDTTRAYQGFGRGLGLELVERANLAHLSPDRTLLLDLPAELGLTRARRRNADERLFHEERFERLELDFHERVRAGYLELAAASAGRMRVVDASLKKNARRIRARVVNRCNRHGVVT